MTFFELNEKQITWWERTKQKGKVNYTSKWMLFWGLPMTLIICLYYWFIENIKLTIIDVLLQILLFAAGSVLISFLHWQLMEYGYKISKNGGSNGDK